MLQFDKLSIRRLLWFGLDVYCFTKMTRILFCQYGYCVICNVPCGAYSNNRCLFSALVITHICSHEVNVTNVRNCHMLDLPIVNTL